MADTAPGGWLNRRTLTWAGYDVASSVYFGVAPAVLLPIYFQQQLAGFANPTVAWGALAAGAILASSLAAPAAWPKWAETLLRAKGKCHPLLKVPGGPSLPRH